MGASLSGSIRMTLTRGSRSKTPRGMIHHSSASGIRFNSYGLRDSLCQGRDNMRRAVSASARGPSGRSSQSTPRKD
jgi:hypothetical protein